MKKQSYASIIDEIKNDTSTRTIDHLTDAVAAKDCDKAEEFARLTIEKKTNFHHFAVRWVNQTLRNFKKHAPDQAILDCMEDYALWCYPPVLQPWMEKARKGEATWEDFPLEDFLKNRAILWQGMHDNGDQVWEEDENTITFTLLRCNSGGWLVSECDDEIVTLDAAHVESYNREGFQCYCLNCTTMWEFGWYKWFGWPLFIMDVPVIGSNGCCMMTLYKDPRDIPDSYYEKRGLARKI